MLRNRTGQASYEQTFENRSHSAPLKQVEVDGALRPCIVSWWTKLHTMTTNLQVKGLAVTWPLLPLMRHP